MPRLGDGLRPIEKDPTQPGVRAQDGRKKRAVAAAYIDDRPKAGEVAGNGDRVILLDAAARHRGVEDGARRRVARQEGEEVRAVDPLEGGPPGLNAVEQMLRGPRVPLLPHQQDVVADGVGGVVPQRSGLGREAEASVLAFGEDPDAGQRAQDAVQGRGVHPGSRRQCLGIERAILEEVRDAEPGDDTDGPGDPEAERLLEQRERWRYAIRTHRTHLPTGMPSTRRAMSRHYVHGCTIVTPPRTPS